MEGISYLVEGQSKGLAVISQKVVFVVIH
jgi:hypothetical protein